ncbi:hypothetical protein CAPTEDRAFT_207723 [Capitella teleta]|uniref:Neurotransmitter-gated ion-channel ligand-binding domain-containing protein n=1 Tax=Capitella teleta TaxID=283909 RepID=R7TJB3_CAPTE|nr:hypothetical protein CAPTEDRAFT_207723 [Capitella teleta]|eukprot:ELT91195.1 hypothetical protein CAPTEDRAFT_207723 [Capitella teleta]
MLLHSEIRHWRRIKISAEKRLTLEMTKRYKAIGQGGRPVVNTNTTTFVYFGLGLIQMELDEREKVFESSMWVKMKWHDEYLQWSPADYQGVETIRLDANQIWVPDVMLINTANPMRILRNTLVLVNYNGSITWIPHQIFHSSCSLDVTAFPFDRQVCHMWFGSWTHTTQEIDLGLADKGLDVTTFRSDFYESSEWEIIHHHSKRIYGNDPTDYTVLSFELHVRRKVVFSSYILTLPCVFLASLTLVVFCLPPERPDRTGLSMSLFSSFLVLLLILVEAAPPTASSVPKLGLYYSFNMVIIMLSIFLSSLVVSVNRSGYSSKKLPKWAKVLLIEILGRLFLVGDMKCSKTPAKPRKTSIHEETSIDCTDELLSNGVSMSAKRYISPEASVLSEPLTALENQLTEMAKCIKRIELQTEEWRRENSALRYSFNEWQLAAKVLDRVFFSIYLVGIVISLVTLFPRGESW